MSQKKKEKNPGFWPSAFVETVKESFPFIFAPSFFITLILLCSSLLPYLFYLPFQPSLLPAQPLSLSVSHIYEVKVVDLLFYFHAIDTRGRIIWHF